MNIIETNLKRNGDLTYNNTPTKIILHHAESTSCTIEDINSWHLANGWTMCGYHYFVRKDGSIYRGRPEGAQGAHCPSQNTLSIGICAEGSYTAETMPEAQKQSIVELSKDICGRYGITEIGGHKEYYPTNCPGDNYPLQDIKNLILNSSTKNYLSLGDTGDEVTELQKKLEKAIGAQFTQYGTFDQDVNNAVCYFQQQYGLVVDGEVGAYTMSIIDSKLKRYKVTISPFKEDDLSLVKDKLNSIGYGDDVISISEI